MTRLLAALTISCLLVAGCGSRQIEIATGRTIPAGSLGSPDAEPDAEPDGVGASASAAARDGVVSAQGGPTGLPSGPAKRNTMKLLVSLNRVCARTGDEMRATAVTEPGAKLAFAAAYSDNSLVPDFTYVPGEGNATGTFTWIWVIRPEIPPGDALLTVVAAKDGKGASFDHPFRIARAC